VKDVVREEVKTLVVSFVLSMPGDIPSFVDSILIETEDYSAPRVALPFWSGLLLDIREQGYREVIFTCLGGHGRTGTGMASLLIASGIDAEKSIEIVRNAYCNLAIETKIQEDYLKSL